MEIAFENSLPLISLVQSVCRHAHPTRAAFVLTQTQAGVFLPQQFRVFHKGGQLFRDLAVRTQHGKPSCAIVFGSSTAGGAYHPALSDYTIFVENQGQAYLGGPPLVKMATGETIGAEELGGAKVHATITGLADALAADEYDACPPVLVVIWLICIGLRLFEKPANGWHHCMLEHPGRCSICGRPQSPDIQSRSCCLW